MEVRIYTRNFSEALKRHAAATRHWWKVIPFQQSQGALQTPKPSYRGCSGSCPNNQILACVSGKTACLRSKNTLSMVSTLQALEKGRGQKKGGMAGWEAVWRRLGCSYSPGSLGRRKKRPQGTCLSLTPVTGGGLTWGWAATCSFLSPRS